MRSKPFIDVGFDEEPPEVDLAQLRQLTEAAIQRGKDKEAKLIARLQAAEEREAAQHRLMAATILAEFPDKCEKEATRGRSHAIVMGMKSGRDYTGWNIPSIGFVASESLSGPALIVWNYLEKAGMKPVIERWDDGVGMNGGFNIVVSW